LRATELLIHCGLLSCLGFLAGGCAEGGIDHEDELSTTDDGRYELVVLEDETAPEDSILGKSPADLSGQPANAAVFFDPGGQFTVQVGVYKDTEQAAKIVRDLKSEGYPAYGAQNREGMRVRIGYFSDREDAERFGRIFAADRGVEFWVDKRAEE